MLPWSRPEVEEVECRHSQAMCNTKVNTVAGWMFESAPGSPEDWWQDMDVGIYCLTFTKTYLQ